MADPIDLKQIAEETAKLQWSLDQYGSVVTPDGKTARVNGFATVCAYGDEQIASKARTRLLVEVTSAFPAVVAELEGLRASNAANMALIEKIMRDVAAEASHAPSQRKFTREDWEFMINHGMDRIKKGWTNETL